MHVKPIWTLFLSLCLFGTPTYAQDLQEMEFEELPSSGLIVDSPEAAVLIVETTIVPLSFNSRGGIRRFDDSQEGVYQVFLNPGVHIIEVMAKGYLPLKLPRWNFAPKSGRKIRVRTKAQFGAHAQFDAERPELRLDYAASSGEEVYVQLDDNPPQKLDFSKGYVVLRPMPGPHAVKVYSGGRMWQRTLDMEARQQYRETVSMDEGTQQQFTASSPGNLFVESAPPGATVYLNQVEQAGVTPLTLNDLQPGAYQIEVTLAQHLPATRQVAVRELEYTNISMELTPNYGQITVNSTPPGAIIYLNDQQSGNTPFSTRLDAGTYLLRLVQSYYYDEVDTLRIEPGTTFDHTYPLRPRFGSVAVSSEPAGATVRVGGESWGQTPLRRERVLSGRHLLEVERAPYPRQERTIEVGDGESQTVHFNMSSTVGHLSIISDPPNAVVQVKESGKDLGRTPLQDVLMVPGTYTLVFTLPNHDALESIVPVVQGERPTIKVALDRHVGHLRVESTPPRATIFLNGVERGTTPQILRDLPTGTYSLRLDLKGYDANAVSVLIEHDQVADQRISLGTAGTEARNIRRSKARKLALFPGLGLGQLISPGHHMRGMMYLLGFGGLGYLAYNAHTQYGTAETDYNEAMRAYSDAVVQSAIDARYRSAQQAADKMDTNRRLFFMSLAAAGGVYGIQLIDALISGGGDVQSSAVVRQKPGVSPLVQLGGREARLGMVWRF